MKKELFGILLPTDERHITEIRPENTTDFVLNELYRVLKCDLIDIVYLEDGFIMVIDDEGKLKDSPINPSATIIARGRGGIRADDYIVGNAIYCPSSMVR